MAASIPPITVVPRIRREATPLSGSVPRRSWQAASLGWQRQSPVHPSIALWALWLPCNMAVNPLHGMGSREGKTSNQHFVKRDSERVEVASGIDRTVHTSGLFWCPLEEISPRLCNIGRLQRYCMSTARICLHRWQQSWQRSSRCWAFSPCSAPF